jgi:hypothetical protein
LLAQKWMEGYKRSREFSLSWSFFCSPTGRSRVFKPKDEEPYGRLNPKVTSIVIGTENVFHAPPFDRRRNGYIDNFDGLSPLVGPVSYRISGECSGFYEGMFLRDAFVAIYPRLQRRCWINVWSCTSFHVHSWCLCRARLVNISGGIRSAYSHG